MKREVAAKQGRFFCGVSPIQETGRQLCDSRAILVFKLRSVRRHKVCVRGEN